MSASETAQGDARPDALDASATSGSRRKLSILYMQLKTDSFAGIERVVDEISSELVDKYGQEFEIDVFYPSRYRNHQVGDRDYNKIEVEVHGRVDFMRAVRKAVSRKKYDVIVVPQVEPTVIVWFACLGLPTRLVAHLHGNPKLETHHFKAKVLFYLMDKVVLNRLSAVFGTSPKQLEAFMAMFPSAVPHRWTPNPVRRFDVPADKAPAVSNLVTFINVARFSYQKGQDILLNAFAQLYELRENVRLRLVGFGDDEQMLRQKIAALGLATVVSIEHYPDNPQQAFATSDIYVSASRWEGWSLAICEALRFGMPVIATDCEFGPSDILTDGRLGRLVPLADRADFVDAMTYYCDHLTAERAHSDYRKTFIDQFSVEKVVHIHADALRLAAGGAQDRRSVM